MTVVIIKCVLEAILKAVVVFYVTKALDYIHTHIPKKR